jgi:hypothetical protein
LSLSVILNIYRITQQKLLNTFLSTVLSIPISVIDISNRFCFIFYFHVYLFLNIFFLFCWLSNGLSLCWGWNSIHPRKSSQITSLPNSFIVDLKIYGVSSSIVHISLMLMQLYGCVEMFSFQISLHALHCYVPRQRISLLPVLF